MLRRVECWKAEKKNREKEEERVRKGSVRVRRKPMRECPRGTEVGASFFFCYLVACLRVKVK